MTALNGQIIGQVGHATRAVLERLLARSGTSFHASVALNQTAAAGGELATDALVSRIVAGLKIDTSRAAEVVAGLTLEGLLEPAPEGVGRLRLSSAGWGRFREIRSGIDEITARLYGGIPEEDLAVAGRVLVLVTERADAELAGQGDLRSG